MNNVILYAKKWYEEGNLIEDLCEVLGADGYQPETPNDIFSILSSMMEKVIQNKPFRFTWFVNKLQDNASLGFHESYFRAVLATFHLLSGEEVEKIFGKKLLPPNFSVLPAKRFFDEEMLKSVFA